MLEIFKNDLTGKMVNCTLKNGKEYYGTIESWNDETIFINTGEAVVLIFLDYVGAIMVVN